MNAGDGCVRCGGSTDLTQLTRFGLTGVEKKTVCQGCCTPIEAVFIGHDNEALLALVFSPAASLTKG